MCSFVRFWQACARRRSNSLERSVASTRRRSGEASVRSSGNNPHGGIVVLPCSHWAAWRTRKMVRSTIVATLRNQSMFFRASTDSTGKGLAM